MGLLHSINGTSIAPVSSRSYWQNVPHVKPHPIEPGGAHQPPQGSTGHSRSSGVVGRITSAVLSPLTKHEAVGQASLCHTTSLRVSLCALCHLRPWPRQRWAHGGLHRARGVVSHMRAVPPPWHKEALCQRYAGWGSASRPDLCRGCRVTGIPTAIYRHAIQQRPPHSLGFLHHSPRRLCYDGVVHGQGGRAPGREETRWTLWPSWIR